MKLCKFLCWCLLLFGAVYVIECAVKKHNGGATRRRMQSDVKRVESFDASSESAITSARIHKRLGLFEYECYMNNNMSSNQNPNTCIKKFVIFCFEYEYYEQSLWKFQRGCCKDREECDSFCNTKKKSYTVGHCNTCHKSKCNNKTMYGFACFVDDNFEFSCWSEEVCYTIMVHQQQTNKSLAVVRGCVKTDENYCNGVQLEISNKYPEAQFPRECKLCFKHKCNRDKYIARYCYVCNENSTACNTVDRQNTQTNITLLECCTIITFFDRNKGGMWREQGLVDEFITGNCTSYCGNHKTAIECDYCQDSFCNKIEFKPLPVGVVCEKCNTVNLKTVTNITVPYQRCCYVAVIKNITGDTYFVKRDCLFENNTECKDVCKDVTNVYECEACQDNGLMKHCNADTKIPKIHCYQCNGIDCNEIDKNKTKVVECESLCCYSYSKFSKKDGRVSWRDCCDGPNANYKNYCAKQIKISTNQTFEIQNCTACNDRSCNSRKLPSKFYCYNCTECNKIYKNTIQDECVSPQCCYTAHLRNVSTQPLMAVRNCLKWTVGMKCSQTVTCENVLTSHKLRYPDGPFEKCMTCPAGAASGCNDVAYAPPSIKCHGCSGRYCLGVPDAEGGIKCEYMCCYAMIRFGPNGFLYQRGCAKEIRACDSSYCDYELKLRESTKKDAEIVKCTACPDNLCNNMRIEPFKCYQCEKCNQVSPQNTKLVDCINPRCCYTAYIQNVEYRPYFASRGCLKWELGVDCGKTCEEIKKNHEGPFLNCTSCNEGDPTGCNNKTYTPPSIECYKCTNCSTIVPGETSKTKCENLCCYTHTSYSASGLYVVRDCCDEMRPCETYCNHYKQSFETSHPTDDYLSCDSCNSSLCNKKELQKPLRCYNCTRCNNVTHFAADLIECFAPRCCYTAHLQYIENEELFAIRGCLEWSKGIECTDERTSKSLEEHHRRNHPGGSFERCETCPTRSTSGCNGRPYFPPQMCHNCTGETCNDVTKTTPSIRCDSRCCYAATTYGAQGHTNIRACAATDPADCASYCTSGVFARSQTVALHCRTCSAFKCNNESLRPPFRCYECANCNEVQNTTSLLECVQPRCCYTAHIQETLHENFFARRGCAPFSVQQYTASSCEEACRNFEGSFVEHNSDGGFLQCTTCGANGTSGCNRITYRPPPRCYQCRGLNCHDTVVNHVDDAECSTQTCYSATTIAQGSGVNMRGCADEPCEAFVVRFRREHADEEIVDLKCCSSFKCNRWKLTRPAKCIHCAHCDTVPRKPNMVACRSSACCYIVYLRHDEHDKYFAKRGCGVWKGDQGCPDIVLDLEVEHMQIFPYGDVAGYDVCPPDANDGCNNATFDPASMVIPPGPPSISCYNCRNCNGVPYGTTQIRCSQPGCCYRAAVREVPGEDLFAIRGCVAVQRGQSCQDMCKVVERRHMVTYTNGTLLVCITCNEGDDDECNYHQFILRRDITIETEPIRCLKCTDCDQTCSTTENMNCRSPECCYTASLKNSENGEIYVVRGCDDWYPELSCGYTCEHVARFHKVKYPSGSVVTCFTCKEDALDECNSFPFRRRMPAKNIVMSKSLVSFACYSCRNCSVVISVTATIPCQDKHCCYRALVNTKPHEEVIAVRGCMTLKDGQWCGDTCKYVAENHNLQHPDDEMIVCKTCRWDDGDTCNDAPYIAVSDDRPVWRMAEPNPIQCYECTNCSEVSPETATIDCHKADCCYTVYVKDHSNSPYYAVRDCHPFGADMSCSATCDLVKSLRLWNYPLGEFYECIPCLSDGQDLCNDYVFSPPITTTTARHRRPYGLFACYKCENCPIITATTDVVECLSLDCCYAALVKYNKEDSDSVVIRGCSSPDLSGNCKDACADVSTNHLWYHTNGVFVNCTVCAADATNECNSATFSQPSV